MTEMKERLKFKQIKLLHNDKKTIVTVFFALNADTVGNAARISRYQWISTHYNLIVLTNHASLLKDKINGKIIYVPYVGLPIISIYLFWLICGIRLFFLKYDLLFLSFAEAPIAFFNFKKPFLCHIHQTHEILMASEKYKDKSIKNIILLNIHNIYTFLIIEGIKKADYSFVLSHQLIDFYAKKGVDKNRMEYLPNGANLKIFSETNQTSNNMMTIIPNNKFVMMYTGWVHEIRGLELMLSGTKEIIKIASDVFLVIIGADKEYIKKINMKLQEMNLSDNVIVMGRIDHAFIPSYLVKADVCLTFLEINETYCMCPPQKMYEYFAMGKPIIANRIPSHTDFITDGVNGFIIELNVMEFKNAVLKLHDDKKLYELMSKNAKETSKLYDLEKINKKIGGKIDKLILNKNSP
ncbi:MAG: glycosyltransferase [Candidatus Aenigmarchaeota archaeon]|nr:glycosyltransferase [Candidatus Aenigmarchaeota archaeon]